MSKKVNATEITNQRESTLVNYLNGDAILESDLVSFPCSITDFSSLITSVKKSEPSFKQCCKKGGMGSDVDLVFETDTTQKGVELKVCDKKISKEVLEWHPWEGAVQFLQGQITSKAISSFLGDCGVDMLPSWLQIVHAIMLTDIPSFTLPTLEDYKKIVFTIGSEKKLTTPAAKLIQELRENEKLRQEFQESWLRFENTWFSSHKPDTAAFQRVLKSVLEEKDYWININKSGAFLIEGFNVIGLNYVGTAQKPGGGCVFRYSIKLQKKISKETQEVPIVLKFYWKNGGQGVQNINILCVSDTFA